MSRPRRFYADHDLNGYLIEGVLRREPAIELLRAREAGMHARPDPEVLEFASQHGLIIVSHDVNTMGAAAFERMSRGEPMAGLFLIHQRRSIGAVIDDLVFVWAASEAEEWVGRVEYLPFR